MTDAKYAIVIATLALTMAIASQWQVLEMRAHLTALERQPRYAIGTVYGDLPTTTTAPAKGEGEAK